MEPALQGAETIGEGYGIPPLKGLDRGHIQPSRTEVADGSVKMSAIAQLKLHLQINLGPYIPLALDHILHIQDTAVSRPRFPCFQIRGIPPYGDLALGHDQAALVVVKIHPGLKPGILKLIIRKEQCDTVLCMNDPCFRQALSLWGVNHTPAAIF
jgi:hypothetical protein